MAPTASLTILDYGRIVWRARWPILAVAALAAAVAFGLGRLQPKIYTARATILPPRESTTPFSISIGGLLLGAVGSGGGKEGSGVSLPGFSLPLPSLSPNQDMFTALLKSRKMRDGVVAELAKTWGPLVGGMIVSASPDTKERGVLAVFVEARDPQLAAAAANTYFTKLDEILEQYSEQTVRRQEASYATQLERAAKEVESAENAVLKFQAENRMIPIEPGTKTQVDSVANLRGYIMGVEMQREIMRMRFTDQHPQMRELEKQIAELKRQYSQNLFGEAMDLPPESPGAKGARKEFFVAAAKMTPVQFAFLKLYRHLKIQEAFYVAALQGLQHIKYSGNGSLRIDFLDPALPPGGPSRPHVGFITAVAAVGGLVAGVFGAFLLEYVRGAREDERRARRPETGGNGGPAGARERLAEPDQVPLGRA